jgi:hypothetical protein
MAASATSAFSREQTSSSGGAKSAQGQELTFRAIETGASADANATVNPERAVGKAGNAHLVLAQVANVD